MNINTSNYSSSIQSSSSALSQSSERVSSGQRINNSSDDAAGLAISNRMTSQITGYNQSIKNANDGVSMLQTADASLQGVTDTVSRLRELALQASNGTLTDSDRSIINKEAQELISGVTQSVDSSSFNNKPLLSGGSNIQLQVGPESEDQIEVKVDDLSQRLSDAGFEDIDFSTAKGASESLAVLDTVQGDVDQIGSSIGAGINRLDSSISNLQTSAVSAQGSRSQIRDADMAKEISNLANAQVQKEVAIAMQVLANQDKGSVLRLLQ